MNARHQPAMWGMVCRIVRKVSRKEAATAICQIGAKMIKSSTMPHIHSPLVGKNNFVNQTNKQTDSACTCDTHRSWSTLLAPA